MIKAIVFDMGGVIVPLDLQRSLDNFKTRAGFENIGDFLNATHQAGCIGEMEAGRITEDEFYADCLKYCKPGTTKEIIYECFSSLLVGISDDALRLISELSQKYDIYLLSNNNPLSMKWLDAELAKRGMVQSDLYKKAFLSFQLKMLKPSPEIYLKAIEEIGVQPNEILFIDDSMKNIDGARAVGINAMFYDINTNLYDEVTRHIASLQQ